MKQCWYIKLGAYYLQGDNGWVITRGVARDFTSEKEAAKVVAAFKNEFIKVTSS